MADPTVPATNTPSIPQNDLQPPVFLENENTAEAPPAPEARRKTGETKVSYTAPNDKFILRAGFGLGIPPLTGIGGPNGGLFNLDSNAANANGDYSFYDIMLQGDFRLTRLFGDNASVLGGAYARYSAHRGNLNTGGSYMNLGGAGLSLALDWKNSMQTWPVLIPSRIAVLGGILAGSGETTAGNHFSVSDTQGTGYNFRLEADLLGININNSGDSINLGWFYETLTIPNARGDAAYPGWATGPALSLALVYPGATRIESRTDIELCRADEFTLEEKVRNLKTLQDEVAQSIIQLRALGSYLQESYGWTSEKINVVLRSTWVEYLTSVEKADPKYQGKSPEEVNSALDVLKSEFQAQANARYPEGTDHFDYPLPAQFTDLSTLKELPVDCDEQESLSDQIDRDREILLEAKFRVDERKKYLPLLSFFGEGNPLNMIGGLALVNFPPINFLQGKPDYGIVNDGPGAASKTHMDRIENFYAENIARLAAGDFFKANDPALQRIFKGIFPGNELPLLSDSVDQLTGRKPLRGIREAGLDAAKQAALVQKMRILVVAGVSYSDGETDKNQILSDNRARAVAVAMILMGMPADRVRAKGLGATSPVVPETVDGSKDGKKLEHYKWAREKNRFVAIWPDFQNEDQMNAQPEVQAPADAGLAPKSNQ